MLLSLVKDALVRREGKPESSIPGLLSRDAKRPIPSIKKPREWTFCEQTHDVRAGRHSDLRLSDGKTAFSWAIRKGLPSKPGEKFLATRTDDHSPSYLPFQGKIKSGYGKGTVRLKRYGDARVIEASGDKIKFATLDKKNPQEFTMIRTGKYGKDRWLVLNTTPTAKTRPDIPVGKERFKESSLEDVGRFMTSRYLLSSKIDGGSAIVDIGKKGVGIFSHRASKKSGELINHSHLFNFDDLPKSLRGTQFKAEIFGKQGKKVIPLRRLSGLLNSSPMKARREMKKSKIRLLLAPWKMLRYKGKKVEDLPYESQIDLMKDVTGHLPGRFVLPTIARGPSAKAALIEKIREGRHHLTGEGVVAWPTKAVSPVPTKVPFKKHTQVYIGEIYPMKGKKDLAGGFTYRLKVGGPIVGRCGTGFDMKQRKEFWRDRKAFRGVKVVIHNKGQFPSGAYRAPVFESLHL